MDGGVQNQPGKGATRIGSYRIVQQLGSGGMSSVFRAVHEETGHEVALKLLPRVLAKNPTLLQRFLREAKSAEALEHPTIVSIYDRGVDEGRHYLILEYVPGGDLHERVKTDGPLPIPEAVRVIRVVAEGLRYAASRGLIHRDIKPANLLVSPTGAVKIIDLGLALQPEAEDERVTRDGTTVGTVDYMPPEQARDSRATSIRSDIYSLGCTLYFLLTGSPPFPGGDLADKLSRHCTKPAPDPRELRPEVPAKLAAVVQRMMAKKPENRYEDYDKLIAALDAVPLDGADGPGEPLFALVDDDDEESDAAPPAALDALIDEDEPSGEAPAALDALIDDDDELPETRPRSNGKRPKDTPIVASVPLSELAALADDRPRSSERVPSPPRASPKAMALEAMLDDEETVSVSGPPPRAMRRSDFSTKDWVVRCAVIGVTLVALVIGIDQLRRASQRDTEPTPEPSETETAPEAVAPSIPAPTSARAPDRPLVVPKAVPNKKAAPAQAAPTVWVEPKDPPSESAPDDDLGGLVARYLPEWATAPIPEKLAGPVLTLKRIVDPNAATERATLRQAFEISGGTVEVADDGPFFEHDLRIGESHLIRAREGFRPILSVDTPKLGVDRQQPAAVIVDGKEGRQFILDGLDLVVDVEDLPREQSALFLCRGANLTLRNCTITVVNRKALPFAVVRTADGGRPARVRLEQTLIRGQANTVVDLGTGTTEVAISRSVLITRQAPLLTASGNDPAAQRRVSLIRSVLACRAPVFSYAAGSPGKNSSPIVVRALGTTFASVKGAGPSSLIDAHDRVGGASEVIDWSGDANVFAGWSRWFVSGPEDAVGIADLAGVRKTWASTDTRSRERAEPWPDSPGFDRLVPGQLRTLAPDRLPTLARVANPSPLLHQKTVVAFDTPQIPTLAPPPPAAAQPAATTAPASPPVTVDPNDRMKAYMKIEAARGLVPTRPVASAPAPGPAPLAEGEVVFDTGEPRWSGDLGRFLLDQRPGPTKRVRVRVRGHGEHIWSPARFTDGTSVEITVEPPAGGDPPRWKAAPGATEGALVAVRGGALILSGVNVSLDAGVGLKALVRVEGGHLVLHRCRLRARGAVEPGAGLVTFLAPSTQPMSPAAGPFATVVDRPICLITESVLIGGGDLINADVGRGLVALSQCALAAGRAAFVLRPSAVARSRFEADLRLDHCTLAAERSFVRLGPWKGTAPGPDRPWVVSSQDSAYVSYYAGGQRESVLLRDEAGGVSLGAVFWQGHNDAYEVPNFTAAGDGPAPANPRPDVLRQWVELWGSHHFKNVTGPGPGKIGSPPSARPVDRLKPGDIAPENLVLDPNIHRDRRALDVGASPARLGLPAPPLRRERR